MPNKYYSLGGAVYDIYQADGTKISTMTTDTNGKATSVPFKTWQLLCLRNQSTCWLPAKQRENSF